jgi:hypothetical protein
MQPRGGSRDALLLQERVDFEIAEIVPAIEDAYAAHYQVPPLGSVAPAT